MNPKQIKRLRESHSMTQGELASHLGVDRTTISRWERGRSVPIPSLVDALKLMKNGRK